MQQTYQVPEANLATLQVRLAKIARRCRRIKVAEPVLTVGQPQDVEYTQHDEILGDSKRVRRVFPVTLDSPERPRIDGFEFAAVISPVTDEDGKHLGNILRMVPGFDQPVPERFRQATNHCDHCQTSRMRLETFVIANQDGFKQVGRNCLANYLGLTNPHALAELAEMLIDVDDLMHMSEGEGFGGGYIPERFPVDEILQVSSSAIRQYGWLSNKSAREFEKTSTSQLVREWVLGNKKTRDNFEHPLTPVSEEDKTLALETESWLESLNGHTDNDYLYNLSLLSQATSITSKNFGILVSAISAYSREKERAIRRNARIEADTKSEFMGVVGERLTIENALVVFATTFESQFGVTHFFKFKVGDNVLVYFASNKMFEQGETIPVMAARVKKHESRVDNYNPQGVKQTVITRASIPARELSKEEKKAINKLKRIRKTVLYSLTEDGGSENYQAHSTLDELIELIKKGDNARNPPVSVPSRGRQTS